MEPHKDSILYSHIYIVINVVITTFIYIYNIRNNFIVTEQLMCKSNKNILYFIGLGCISSALFSPQSNSENSLSCVKLIPKQVA